MTHPSLLTVALAQMQVGAAPEENFRRAAEAVAQAAAQHADLVLLPELWPCEHALARPQACADPAGQGFFARMQALAQAYRVAVGGSHLERDGDRFYNTFALYAPDGRLWGAYRKIHRFLPMGEDILTPGEVVGLAATPWGEVGLAVCYDLRFPEIFRLQATAGARLLLVVAAWPEARIRHWDALLPARAIENQAFVAAVNRAGGQGTAPFGGHSSVLSPQGESLARAGSQETVLLATLDLAQADAYRRAFPALEHRSPEAYRLGGEP